MPKRPLFAGVCTALVTPFTKDGEAIDIPALDALIERQLSSGVAALLPCGTTGEPSTLTDKEWETVVACTVRAARGRVPVIAGTGSNNPRRTVEKARRAQELGADAQLCVTPYYNKATQRGLVAYYRHVASQSDLPMIVYNVPSRTGVNLLPQTAAELAALPTFAGVKEASGSLNQASELLQTCPPPVYCGADEVIVPMIRLGAAGAISVLSNLIPEAAVKMTKNALEGRAQCASDRQKQLAPLIGALFCEVSPAPVKAAMALLGLCGDDVRLPLVRMEKENLQKLRAAMIAEGLLTA